MILYGADADVCRWASSEFFGRPDLFDGDKAIGIVRDGKLIAAAMYSDFKARPDGTVYSVEMSAITIDKRWATRHNLRAIFAYPFIQLGLERVQMVTSVTNEGVNKVLPKLGFQKEGVIRKGYVLGGDAYVWGMLKEECEWIK